MAGWVDLNADAGESYGVYTYGHDRELFPLVTSVNLACGFHGGSPNRMREAVALAKAHGVAVGAHPGFPDLVGFGRRDMALSPEEVYADVLYQTGALYAFLRAEGLPLHHVKPHGALYLKACRDRETARAIAEAVKAFDPGLPLVVLPGTVYEEEARRAGLRVVLEAFPERAYLKNGQLAPRSLPGSWITDPKEAARRAVRMVLEGKVEALDGGEVSVRADTLCIHGDNPNAPQVARAVREALEAEGVAVRAF
ncbi:MULTISPECIES: LamB/YcsF family protein [Thermus]|uniref:LamB/YcsF family protein n=1 Tax=Thermus TaxID=270 RepID=UPI001F4877CC|nr:MULTISPECIES: 5-oxoprolinase subunit PxpA [Thermus]